MGMELVRNQTLERIKTLMQENGSSDFRLPSERDLAVRLGVSRTSVREALRTLTNQGLLETRRGAGTRVARTTRPVLENAFEFLLMRTEPSLLDLYETRELIEVYLAGRAAERRTDSDLARIEEALRAMGDGRADPTDLGGPNLRFHMAIAAAAHNPILAEIIACLYAGIHARVATAKTASRRPGAAAPWRKTCSSTTPCWAMMSRGSSTAP